MRAIKPVVLLGTALALVLPAAAPGAAAPAAVRRKGLLLAQYDAGPYGSPYGQGPYGSPYVPGPGPGAFGPGEGAEPYGYGAPGVGPRELGPRRSRSRGAGGTTSYHGFRIVFAGPQSESELAAVQHQIDIVDQAGLSESDMRLFRSRPIEVTGSGGSESNRGTSVVLGNLQAAQSRPILLHEYMHILHRSKFPGGFNNPTIERFYQEALAGNLYPGGSYMMRNRREFFAVTASCYLYGSVERPPYTRQAIAQQQPDYYAYLGRLFGRGGATISPHGGHATMLAAAS